MMRRDPSGFFVTGACVCLLLGLISPARAQEKKDDKGSAKKSESITLTAYVIRAGKSGNKIDPELRDIAGALRKQFKFTSYHIEKKVSVALHEGQEHTFDMIGHRKCTVEVKQIEGSAIKFEVDVIHAAHDNQAERHEKITVTVQRERFQLQGYPVNDSDDMQILAISGK